MNTQYLPNWAPLVPLTPIAIVVALSLLHWGIQSAKSLRDAWPCVKRSFAQNF